MAGPQRLSLLSEHVYSDVSTVSRQVTLLASHGLLEKLSDPQDGRACMVSLSDEGAALVDHLKASRGEWFRQMLQDWEPAEAEVFGDHLERFATAFEASKDMFKSISLPPDILRRATHQRSTLSPRTAVTPSGNALPDTTEKEQ